MVALIPCSNKPRNELISLIKLLYQGIKIILSVDEKINVSGIEVDKIIKHVNIVNMPPKRIWEYYNNILQGFIPELTEYDNNEPILLLHENVIINESSTLLINDISEYIFSSAKKRETKPPFVLKDNSDRCIAFTKENFVLCHTFENTENSFLNKTTLDFICEELDKLGLQYIYRNEVFISEPGTIWG
jgi:hypothetical protein